MQDQASLSRSVRLGRTPLIVTIALVLAVAAALTGIYKPWNFLRYGRADPPLPSGTELEKPLADRIQERVEHVRAHPYDAKLWGSLAETYDVHGILQEAIFCYERAQKLDRKDPRWPYLLGLAQRIGDQKAALACFERAIALAPDMAAAHFFAGHGYLQSERFDEAQREFTRALELEPEDPAVLIGLAKVSLSKHEPKLAIGFLERAIAKKPATREAYWLMASAWRDAGDEAKAAEYSKPGEPPPQQEAFADKLRSQQLGNEGVTLRFARMRADVLLARDQAEEALAELTRYLDKVPKSAAALAALGDLYMKLDRPMDAIPRYQAAISIDPALAQALLMWGTALYRTGKPEEGIEKTRQAVTLEPMELDFKSNLANMLAAQGTKPALEEALGLMNDVTKARPQDPRGWISLAQVLGASTKANEAIAAFQKAVDLAPNDAGVRHEFGVLCARVGHIPEAAEAFAAVVKADPSRMEARTNLIHALTMLSRHTEAIAALRSALEIAPKNPQFRAQLAWLLATSKDDAARSGTEALSIARGLVEDSQGKNPEFLVIQAAAEAEAGDFPSAILSIEAGLELLKPKPGGDGSVVQDPMLVGIIDRALACRKVFQEGRPYRTEVP